MTTVIVLNDGETFTDIAGCRIVELPDCGLGDYTDVVVKEADAAGGSAEEALSEARDAGYNVPEDATARTIYAFTGNETGGVALTESLEDRVVEAIEQQQSYTDGPDSLDAHRGRPLYDALLALARACDIEVNVPREEPA